MKQNILSASVEIKNTNPFKDEQNKEKTFWKRFTLKRILKIIYLLLAVSFGHGIIALIIYFMANKKYGIFFVIGALISAVLHFLYESYEILYDEEILMAKLILRKKLKIKIIRIGKYEFNLRE